MDRWIDMQTEAKYGRAVLFALGGVYFDQDAKELVRITNGVCVLDHSTPEAFKAAHTEPRCLYAPSEVIALRVMGVTHNGDPVIAHTYRRVRPEVLASVPVESDWPMSILDKVRRSRKIGRV